MKLTKEQVKQWFIDIEEDMCGNANDAAEVHALRDLALSALSQTAPSAQEGVREAVKKLVGVALAVAANSDEEGAVAKVTEAANAALSATPSASALGEALESVTNAMSTWPGDWGQDARHAWIYGVLVGWDDALGEVAKQHGWDTGTVERLCRMRSAIAALADTDGKKGE